MKHIWSVVCSKSITDVNSNNVSLVEVIEQVQFVQTKKRDKGTDEAFTPVIVEWVSLWMRTDIETSEVGDARDIVLSPSGKKILERKYQVNLENHKRSRQTRRIRLPLIIEDGMHLLRTQVKLNNNWKTVSDVPVFVTITQK